jgi:hypothetical protein
MTRLTFYRATSLGFRLVHGMPPRRELLAESNPRLARDTRHTPQVSYRPHLQTALSLDLSMSHPLDREASKRRLAILMPVLIHSERGSSQLSPRSTRQVSATLPHLRNREQAGLRPAILWWLLHASRSPTLPLGFRHTSWSSLTSFFGSGGSSGSSRSRLQLREASCLQVLSQP